MKEEIVYTASKILGFTPLELVLLATVGTMAIAIWRFLVKHSKESTLAINNNTTALNRATDMMANKVKKVIKR